MTSANIFDLPVLDHHLIYAPLHGVSALMNDCARQSLIAALVQTAPAGGQLSAMRARLQQVVAPPRANTGAIKHPLFLGVIPTRGCNMACRYCDFSAPKTTSPRMSPETARDAVDAYIHLLQAQGLEHLEVHFFGGEPFFAAELIEFIIAYARQQAESLGFSTWFEVITNGLLSQNLAQWVAANFDTVVLSHDGLPEYQNAYRPAPNRAPSAEIVERTAQILSDGDNELILRACVTADSVQEMVTMADYFARKFRPSTVCFEPLTESELSLEAGMLPPDPVTFAQQFHAAACHLRQYGIEAVYSAASIESLAVTFCPVGKDALIITPEGQVNACYLLQSDWEAAGLDMRLGHLDGAQFEISQAAVDRVREHHVDNKPRCENCFCRYHCAGGCHVNHPGNSQAGDYDELCIATRLITAARLLSDLGHGDVASDWLSDPLVIEQIRQVDDHLLHAPTRIGEWT
jgi:radical SAM protein with 4Fe4S-binding SPASM domain